jgi:hypothetical protein
VGRGAGSPPRHGRCPDGRLTSRPALRASVQPRRPSGDRVTGIFGEAPRGLLGRLLLGDAVRLTGPEVDQIRILDRATGARPAARSGGQPPGRRAALRCGTPHAAGWSSRAPAAATTSLIAARTLLATAK